MGKILVSCPNLRVLKGFLHIFETPVGHFAKLNAIELHMPTVETINWFFVNCPCIEEAKVCARIHFKITTFVYYFNKFFFLSTIVVVQ